MRKNIGIQLYMFVIIGTIISDMIYYYPLSESLFGNDGMITTENILSPLFKLQGSVQIYILAILIACLIYIFFDKVRFYSLSIVYVFWFLLLERNTFILDSSSEIISLTLPFVIITHFFEIFSYNSSITTTIFRLSRLGIMVQICIVYLFSFLYKINDTVWLNGTAIYYTLRIDSYLMSDFNIPLTKSAFFVKTSTYFTLLTELLIPLLAWFKRTKTIILLFGFLLHIGIYLFMRIEDFSWVMIASYFTFYTDTEYRKLFKKKLRIFYDDTCSKCKRFAVFISRVDVFKNVEINKLSKLNTEKHSKINLETAQDKMPSINSTGTVYYGFETIIQISKTAPLLFLLYPLFSVLSTVGFGDKMYDRIAKNRCTDECKI